MKTFEIRCVNARFGTEGSEVQILPPRPKYRRKAQEIGPFCCTDGLVKSGRALGSSRGGPLLKFAPTAGFGVRTQTITLVIVVTTRYAQELGWPAMVATARARSRKRWIRAKRTPTVATSSLLLADRKVAGSNPLAPTTF